MDKNTTNSMRGTFGFKGSWGSNWNLARGRDLHPEQAHRGYASFFTQPIEAFFSKIYGPQLGYDPAWRPTSTSPTTRSSTSRSHPAQYASFSGNAYNYSYTEESMARAQVSNPSFSPCRAAMRAWRPKSKAVIRVGLRARFALYRRCGHRPDPDFRLYLDLGHGSPLALRGYDRVQLPIASTVEGRSVRPLRRLPRGGRQYRQGHLQRDAEFKPLKQLAFRGRYGTAFKAPTLADEFQGLNGYYEPLPTTTTATRTATRPRPSAIAPTTTSPFSGRPLAIPSCADHREGLGSGVHARPIDRLQASLITSSTRIRNEVTPHDPNKLLETEAACRLGQLDITSPTCVTALADVTRDSPGAIISIYTPKQNVSQENFGVFIFDLNYLINIPPSVISSSTGRGPIC